MNKNKALAQNIESRAKAQGSQKEGWFAAGGIAGAILAASCCVGPLLLVSLGVSGAWIGNLTALEPFKPYFAAFAILLIGLGFRQVYFAPKKACEDGTYCARPEAALITQIALWAASALVILALTIDYWAPWFY